MDDQYKYNLKEESLREHDRLSRLFKESRFMFEVERKKLIESTIKIAKVKNKKFLKDKQEKWDSILNKAESEHNRLVLIKMLFWDNFYNDFQPVLKNFNNND